MFKIYYMYNFWKSNDIFKNEKSYTLACPKKRIILKTVII